MTIRYKCDSCGSTLNIKEELAGTQGKCPKCKSAFTVPQPAAAVADKPAGPRKKAAPAKSKTAGGADDEFDPMAILMGDDPSPGRQSHAPSEPPLSDEEVPSDLDLELSFDEDADDPPVRKSKKRKRVQFDSDDDMDVDPAVSAAATAGTMLSAGASAGAKDLLTKTMEESRARASRVEEGDSRDRGPTIQDYLREFGPKGAAILGAILVGFFGLYYLASGMYGGGMDLPELGRVYGTVTLDGKPLIGAKVMFTPADKNLKVQGKERQRPRTSTAYTDEEGYYELDYAEEVRGAAVAEHKVSITLFDSKGMLVTPIAYSQYSVEMRTVKDGWNEYDFTLKSDPVPEAPDKRR